MAQRTQTPSYDLPDMAAVANETRPYTDPRATYALARQARDARTEGAFRRRPR